MTKTYRGDIVWLVDAYTIADPYTNRTGCENNTYIHSGFRLAR